MLSIASIDLQGNSKGTLRLVLVECLMSHLKLISISHLISIKAHLIFFLIYIVCHINIFVKLIAYLMYMKLSLILA